ncbi:hypothetical protein [Cognatishimia sp. F0-27]|uniref:hypothetical protein n=1 Tax=Cognatishimia sp. F0-27 TaxID=2816855 RepID=UPI001D0C1034|nr:hypothetical protein [Cognatishimia sp. F0-27]MCC1492513.1 hypothetical protein [Cognatishimia sp. F0-27]
MDVITRPLAAAVRRAGCVLALLLLAPGALGAEPKVYEGREAQALKCAWIIAAAARVLEEAGMISTEDHGVSIAISARILQLYVTGSDRQKLGAFQEIALRNDRSGAVQAFQDQALLCIRQFPVE